MEDIARLEALRAWADQHGLLSRARVLRAGDLAIEVAPQPPHAPPAVATLPDPPPDPSDVERRNLEVLLYSSGADVTPFLPRERPAQ